MVTIKELPKEEYLLKGHAACAGCGPAVSLRHLYKALGNKVMMMVPACCTTVIQGPYPYTSFAVPLQNILFESAAAAASGVVAALKQRKINDVTVVSWAGDGGTVDIGIQALSGAAERGTDFIYICYDNEAYGNTGMQRSGATPYGAWTTTTPSGKRAQERHASHNGRPQNPLCSNSVYLLSIRLHQQVKKSQRDQRNKIHPSACAVSHRMAMRQQQNNRAWQTGRAQWLMGAL